MACGYCPDPTIREPHGCHYAAACDDDHRDDVCHCCDLCRAECETVAKRASSSIDGEVLRRAAPHTPLVATDAEVRAIAKRISRDHRELIIALADDEPAIRRKKS